MTETMMIENNIVMLSKDRQPLNLLVEKFTEAPKYNPWERFMKLFGYKKERVLSLPKTNDSGILEWFDD